MKNLLQDREKNSETRWNRELRNQLFFLAFAFALIFILFKKLNVADFRATETNAMFIEGSSL